MPPLISRPLLQPSLLDRLTDDDPSNREDSAEARSLSMNRMRETLDRDLSWLFNTPCLAGDEDLSSYPYVARSGLNFGIPDLSGRLKSSLDPAALDALIEQIRQAVCDFEPRLRKNSVKVAVVESEGHGNALSFSIEAELWWQPLPLQLYLRTEVNLEDGQAKVAQVRTE